MSFLDLSWLEVIRRSGKEVTPGDMTDIYLQTKPISQPIPVITSASDTLKNVSTSTEARVGASNLTDRVMLLVTPIDGDIHWGLTNPVTTSYPIIRQGETLELNFDDGVTVYIIAATGTVSTHIVEGSG